MLRIKTDGAGTMKKRWLLLPVAAAAAIPLCWTGLVTRTYTIETDRLAEGQRFRAAVVSDLHSTVYGNRQQDLIDEILLGNPDAVLMPGDIYDDERTPEGTELFLAGLSGRVPLYYATGNHEFRVENMDDIWALFDRYGVTVLRDQTVESTLNGVPVTITGLDDPAAHRPIGDSFAAAAARCASALPDAGFHILLSHRPERWEQYKDFDLAVSGHAHGGQVRIPGILNGLLAPNQGWFPARAGGLYQNGTLSHVVSRGLAVYWYLPRVCNPPEVVFVDVVGT